MEWVFNEDYLTWKADGYKGEYNEETNQIDFYKSNNRLVLSVSVIGNPLLHDQADFVPALKIFENFLRG